MKYIIPVTYVMYGKYEVEAKDILEAMEVVQNPALALPPNAEYLEDSMRMNEEDIVECNELTEDERWDVSDYLTEAYRDY